MKRSFPSIVSIRGVPARARWSTALTLLAAMHAGGAPADPALSPKEQLGKSIFFDEELSLEGDQSCATCHAPDAGWTGPLSSINEAGAVYEGSVDGRFGGRKPPSAAYATPAPIFHLSRTHPKKRDKAQFAGGNFWDGRATGEKLGNPAADQAQGPFLNPVEQALSDSACVVHRVCEPAVPDAYDPVTFSAVWGADACDIAWPADVYATCATEGDPVALSDSDRDKVDVAYDLIALSIAAYESSREVNAFTSKYDFYLAGLVDLTREERRGLQLFRGKGKCARCHVLDRGPGGEPPLFTDFTYDNLGVPRNPDNPFYSQTQFNPAGDGWIDVGLGGFLDNRMDYQNYASVSYGKQKVPTLRNVDKRPPDPEFTKAYAHNGYFKSLEEIVHFYNTRDVKPTCSDPMATAEIAIASECWPAPEVAANVNTAELGNLGLRDEDEDAIVTFMKTLSDGYDPYR